MFYEERAEEEESLHELAYADLLYCYTLPGARWAPACWHAETETCITVGVHAEAALLQPQRSVHACMDGHRVHDGMCEMTAFAATLMWQGLLSVPGALAGEVWVEHGYLYDRQDLEAHPMGRRFLEAQRMAPCELVETSSCYHSLASTIEGAHHTCQTHGSSMADYGGGDGEEEEQLSWR